MPTAPMDAAPPGDTEWTTDGWGAKDLGTKPRDKMLLMGRHQKRGQMIAAEERNPLESLQTVSSIIEPEHRGWKRPQDHRAQPCCKEQDLELVLAEREAATVEIKILIV